MKTQQSSLTTSWTEGCRGFGGCVLLASCGLALAFACQSSAKNEAGQVAVSKESTTVAATPPSSASAPVAPAAQPGSSAAVPSPAPAPTAEVKSGEAPLNAPASSKVAAPTPKPQAGSSEANPSADAPVTGETKKGAVVSEEPFSLWLEAASPVAAGSASSVDVVLVAKAPYHTNAEYPHKFKLGAAPAGLTYPEAVVKGMDVKPDRSVLRVPVQAKQPGPATVSGTLSFSVCTEERCLVEKRDLSLALEIK
jgi:hypothetical protein